MKKIISFLFLLSLLVSNTCYSQSGWFESQTNIVYRGLHKNGNMINVACEGGAVLRTTDNGNTWKYVRNGSISYTYDNFYCVYFLNQATGLAAGFSSIVKTTNGGDNWSQVYSTGRRVTGIDFINSNTGYAVGGSQYPYNIILKTNNQGSTWISIAPPTNLCFADIKFLNSTTGFVSGDSGLVMKTTNSGENWTLRRLETAKKLRSLYFINDNTGWIAGDSGKLFKTTDCGINWTVQFSSANYGINDIFFNDVNTGICALDSGLILYTSNGGQNWFSRIVNAKYNLYSVIKTNSDNWLTFGGISTNVKQHAAFKSTNNGTNWEETISGNNYAKWSVYFLDTLTGYVGGLEGTLMKTTNGGITWKLQDVPTSTHIQKIQFINQNTGWIKSYAGWLIRTTNAGLNWAIVNSGIYTFHFFDSSNGVSTCEGYIQKTSNAGLNWVHITQTNAVGIFFVDNKHGWAYGGSEGPFNFACLYRTTDSGNTWDTVSVSLHYRISSVYFLDSLNGWLCLNYPPENQNIYKSTDGGVTWAVISDNHGRNIYFLNYNTGFLLRESSSIWKTFNSGSNWFSVFNVVGAYWWHEIQFVNPMFGWAVSDNGTTGHVVL